MEQINEAVKEWLRASIKSRQELVEDLTKRIDKKAEELVMDRTALAERHEQIAGMQRLLDIAEGREQ